MYVCMYIHTFPKKDKAINAATHNWVSVCVERERERYDVSEYIYEYSASHVYCAMHLQIAPPIRV